MEAWNMFTVSYRQKPDKEYALKLEEVYNFIHVYKDHPEVENHETFSQSLQVH